MTDLAHVGHEIMSMPLFLNFKALRICHATFTSSSGLSEREILIVSPIPFNNKEPMPTEELIVPVNLEPASVMPKCSG